MIRELKLSGIDEIFVHFQWLNRFHFLASYLLNRWADFDACCCIGKLRICASKGCHCYGNRVKTKDLQSVQNSRNCGIFHSIFPELRVKCFQGLKLGFPEILDGYLQSRG
jgi:hypothetical protein